MAALKSAVLLCNALGKILGNFLKRTELDFGTLYGGVFT